VSDNNFLYWTNLKGKNTECSTAVSSKNYLHTTGPNVLNAFWKSKLWCERLEIPWLCILILSPKKWGTPLQNLCTTSSSIFWKTMSVAVLVSELFWIHKADSNLIINTCGSQAERHYAKWPNNGKKSLIIYKMRSLLKIYSFI